MRSTGSRNSGSVTTRAASIWRATRAGYSLSTRIPARDQPLNSCVTAGRPTVNTVSRGRGAKGGFTTTFGRRGSRDPLGVHASASVVIGRGSKPGHGFGMASCRPAAPTPAPRLGGVDGHVLRLVHPGGRDHYQPARY